MDTLPFDDLESPEGVARYLAEPVAAVWKAIDVGRSEADAFFTPERRTRDPHMWAHLVRYEACLSLASMPEPEGWQFKQLRHSGIQIEKGPFAVRLCKATKDGPQSPGRNRARKEFFQQLSLLTLFSGGETQNLILWWRVRSHELELGLCKPKGTWRFKGQPRLEWQKPLSFDPLEGVRFAPIEDEDVEVVPLHFDEEDLGDQADG